jgi:hypothetical protein
MPAVGGLRHGCQLLRRPLCQSQLPTTASPRPCIQALDAHMSILSMSRAREAGLTSRRRASPARCC